MNTRLSDWITHIRSGGPIGREGARDLLGLLVSGEEDTAVIKNLLLALNERGFGGDEVLGFAEGLMERAVTVDIERSPVIDTCGTGGDGLGTFNISTAAALITAGAGIAVAKHGNRSVSSRSGSADVLEALGVDIDPGPEGAKQSVEEVGFGFFFAPRFHPAMKHVAKARRELGVRTIFNVLGPLVNPAHVRRQVVGVYDDGLIETCARALLDMGSEKVMVVRGLDGMDELSPAAPTLVCHGEAGKGLSRETIRPEDAGIARCDPRDLSGGDAGENARTIEETLAGRGGPALEAALLNSGASLVVAGRAETLAQGVTLARKSVDTGSAAGILDALRSRRRPS
ncbi:MAG: anthranilate phosphoribosyltransferase [Deltaproteobacteria bacterium]|nr:anthranilate phosphoribosyltransferase [Deltaproteobacteria bacterium]